MNIDILNFKINEFYFKKILHFVKKKMNVLTETHVICVYIYMCIFIFEKFSNYKRQEWIAD